MSTVTFPKCCHIIRICLSEKTPVRGLELDMTECFPVEKFSERKHLKTFVQCKHENNIKAGISTDKYLV